jgi:hypothetical protein
MTRWTDPGPPPEQDTSWWLGCIWPLLIAVTVAAAWALNRWWI